MASKAEPRPELVISGVQESLRAHELPEYFDVMICGHTGQGKSTTTDKLLIANPDGIKYEANEDILPDEERKKLRCGDISMWITINTELKKIDSRFKSLVFARTQSKPHEMINMIRKEEGSERTRTTDCEVFSNDTTRIRVLDVQGFFDQDSLGSCGQLSPGDAQVNAARSNIGIMRKIIRVQTILNMKFKRILFFIPVRGALERADAVLQLELKVLTHYFGMRVLKKLVLIATNPPQVSALSLAEDQVFPEDTRKGTMQYFKKCLEILFPDERNFPDFPLIYISLNEPCESILRKVQEAKVDGEDIKLELNPATCQLCGKRVGIVKGERVACYIHQFTEDKIPYEESLCHPKLIPDYKQRHRIAEALARIFTFGYVKSLAKFFNLNEICVCCQEAPDAVGCMRVGSEFEYKTEKIKVDHKCNKWTETERDFFEQSDANETDDQ